ncbi:hypothetical protein ABZ951_18550 [Streptomyces sp. NPDC046215]|uniref:Uncharacterized protein n=1 Tax=Streptomyces stramineus TaxID=173861 RepID=A0ABN1AI18_9ACTN
MPDEVWERFARDHERAIRASAPKEPSAQERSEPRPAQGRGKLFAGAARRGRSASPELPEGWRTGPAWREMDGRSTRGRRLRGGVGVLAAVAVILVALNPGKALSWLPGGPEGDAAASHSSPAPLPPETGRPSAAPGGAGADTPTPGRPFAGSPAERYADGPAGIVLPEAEAVGDMTKEQVASALKLTKDFLVAANLDPATLRGERPAAALALLDPLQEGVADTLSAGLSKPDREHDPLMLVSRFDRNEVSMAGETVKTRGRMTFEAGKNGSVAVHADYTFVYPLTKAAKGSHAVERTIVRRVLDTEVLDPARFKVTPGTLVVRSYAVDIANSSCGVYDGFLHPVFDADRRGAARPSGPAVDPYDRSRELDAARGAGGRAGGDDPCGTVTRT